MPVGVQGHLAHRETQMVQHAQLRQPRQGRPAPRPSQGRRQLIACPPGGVSERFKVRLSKSRVAATPPRVRISPPPPRLSSGRLGTKSAVRLSGRRKKPDRSRRDAQEARKNRLTAFEQQAVRTAPCQVILLSEPRR